MRDVQRQPRRTRPRAGRLPWFRPAASLFAMLLACGLAGCRNHNQELLENELRAKDFQYRDLLDEMKKSEFHNESLQREVDAFRRGSKVTPEQAAQNFGLKRIVLGRLTMGVDNDKLPGDEALQVIVEPHDVDGHTIKVPGTVQVTAHEINPQGVKLPLSTWDISEEKVRRSWKQGMFGTGYYFTLPWQSWPQYENVRVAVRFVLSDNRVFEADKDVKVRLVPRDSLPRPTPPPHEPPGGTSESKRSPLRTDVRSSPPAPSRWQPATLGEAVQLVGAEVLE